MIWLTWRQHRRQALFTMLGFAALAAFVVPTGLSMRHAYDRLGLAGCDGGAACNAKFDEFSDTYGPLVLVSVLMLIVPLIVGLFWGAPVVAREVEHGTHRMIWTQGISRRHWALVKTGMLGGAVVAFAVAYGLGMAWWYAPLGRVDFRQTRFTQVFFDMQGVAPVGYTLFAVALGVYAGTVVPKVLPGAYNAQVFQPADRFWPFQWIETGIFVALAACLIWLAVRRIRRLA